MDYKCATFTLMELNLALSLTSTASRSCKAIFKGCQRRLLATPSMDEDLVCMHAYFCPLSKEAYLAYLYLMKITTLSK